MLIYWNPKSIPEFSNLPRPERGTRWRRAYKLTFRHWQTWCAIAIGILIFDVSSRIGGMFGHPTVGIFISAMLWGSFFEPVVIYVARKYYRDVLLGQDCPGQIINVYRPQ